METRQTNAPLTQTNVQDGQTIWTPKKSSLYGQQEMTGCVGKDDFHSEMVYWFVFDTLLGELHRIKATTDGHRHKRRDYLLRDNNSPLNWPVLKSHEFIHWRVHKAIRRVIVCGMTERQQSKLLSPPPPTQPSFCNSHICQTEATSNRKMRRKIRTRTFRMFIQTASQLVCSCLFRFWFERSRH